MVYFVESQMRPTNTMTLDSTKGHISTVIDSIENLPWMKRGELDYSNRRCCKNSKAVQLLRSGLQCV